MEKLFKTRAKTPLGNMIIITSKKGLCFLEYEKPKRKSMLDKRLNTFYKEEVEEGSNEITEKTKKWLTLYFEGGKKFPKISLDVRGSNFEKKVWKTIEKVSYGETISYGDIAKKIGNPKAARAVGGATGRNPVSLIVPCHRIVGSDNKITGYGGGIDKKKWLLKHESK